MVSCAFRLRFPQLSRRRRRLGVRELDEGEAAGGAVGEAFDVHVLHLWRSQMEPSISVEVSTVNIVMGIVFFDSYTGLIGLIWC